MYFRFLIPSFSVLLNLSCPAFSILPNFFHFGQDFLNRNHIWIVWKFTIVEPIRPADLTGRQGLGWNENNGTGRHFKNKVRKILEEYAASNNPYDLVFSSGLTSEQRHEIHVKAAMFKLKHKSFGKGDGRFITISRKFQKEEIISQLQKNGGSNAKFELLLPQKWNMFNEISCYQTIMLLIKYINI